MSFSKTFTEIKPFSHLSSITGSEIKCIPFWKSNATKFNPPGIFLTWNFPDLGLPFYIYSLCVFTPSLLLPSLYFYSLSSLPLSPILLSLNYVGPILKLTAVAIWIWSGRRSWCDGWNSSSLCWCWNFSLKEPIRIFQYKENILTSSST